MQRVDTARGGRQPTWAAQEDGSARGGRQPTLGFQEGFQERWFGVCANTCANPVWHCSAAPRPNTRGIPAAPGRSLGWANGWHANPSSFWYTLQTEQPCLRKLLTRCQLTFALEAAPQPAVGDGSSSASRLLKQHLVKHSAEHHSTPHDVS